MFPHYSLLFSKTLDLFEHRLRLCMCRRREEVSVDLTVASTVCHVMLFPSCLEVLGVVDSNTLRPVDLDSASCCFNGVWLA